MADTAEPPLLLPHQLESLRSVGIEKRFAAGERIISIGAESTEVFYLLHGLVKIVVVSASGTESLFALRTPGVFIGELSTLTKGRRSADVIAVEPTTAMMLTAAGFDRYLEEFPAVALALLHMQSRRLNEMTIRSMLGSRSVKARVAQRLIELSSGIDAGSAVDGQAGIVVRLTQSELAQWVDASREWTSKALAQLQSKGAIQTARGRIIVLDLDALTAISLES